MCMQCMAGAMVAGAGATGVRAWLIARRPRGAQLTIVSRGGRRPVSRSSCSVSAANAAAHEWRLASMAAAATSGCAGTPTLDRGQQAVDVFGLVRAHGPAQERG